MYLARLYKLDPIRFLSTFEVAKNSELIMKKPWGLCDSSAIDKEIIYEFLGIGLFIYNFKPSRNTFMASME